MRYLTLVVLALLTVAPAPASAQSSSQPAVGLVLDVRGATQPDIKPYREVRAGDSVRLFSGAKLVVLQYAQGGSDCRTLTVEGGLVEFPQRGEPVITGGVASRQDGKCPRKLVAKSTSGAVIIRGSATKVTPTPSFVIAGARGSDVGSLRVLESAAQGSSPKISVIPVKGQDFKWPSDAPALAGGLYTIEFLSRENTAVLASVSVFAAAGEEEIPTFVLVD